MALLALAASAGNRHSTLREICRLALLRLSRHAQRHGVHRWCATGFDAICLDRIDGPFPVRSHTGDIGGKMPLGLGQAGLILLAQPARGRSARRSSASTSAPAPPGFHGRNLGARAV